MLRIAAISTFSFQRKNGCRQIMGLRGLEYRNPPINARKSIHPTSDSYKELLKTLQIRIVQLQNDSKYNNALPYEHAESGEFDFRDLSHQSRK